MIRSIAVVVLVLTAGFGAGCSSTEPDTASPGTAATAPAAGGSGATTTATSPDAPSGDASIAVEPANPGCTPDGAYIGTVTWQLPEPADIVIRVGPGEGQLFTEATGNAGRVATGEWVVPGLRFKLESKAGEELAATDAGPGDC